MINIRLLKAFPKSAQYIRLNVLFQWLGLLMNVILSASIAYLIASAIEQRPISWIVFVIMILSLCVRMICNDRAVQMRGCRSARNVFWQLYSAIFLCVARAADIVFDHTMV